MDGAQTAQQASGTIRKGAVQARGRMEETLDRRSGAMAERAGSVAEDARAVADVLRSRGRGAPANWAESLGREVDRLSGYMQGASGQDMRRDMERMGREHPMTLGAIGFAAGFAAARFVKAGAEQQGGGSSGGAQLAQPAQGGRGDAIRPAGAPW
jgi:hypothetical protein